MSFNTTETSYGISGTTAVWLTAHPVFVTSRNSGGIVNIAGPILVKSVFVVPASGRYADASASGVVLAVQHATSGMFAQISGDQIFRFDAVAHSGLSTGNLVITFPPLIGIDYIARSGLVTLNSGTHVFDIIVHYANKQA